jgi:hypothetical protein
VYLVYKRKIVNFKSKPIPIGRREQCMKCLICSENSGERILCRKHTGTDAPLRLLTAYSCNSFSQKKDAVNGICEHFLLCAPIKKALQGESLFNNLGHVTCPYSSINLAQAIYSKFTQDQIRSNYPECIE